MNQKSLLFKDRQIHSTRQKKIRREIEEYAETLDIAADHLDIIKLSLYLAAEHYWCGHISKLKHKRWLFRGKYKLIFAKLIEVPPESFPQIASKSPFKDHSKLIDIFLQENLKKAHTDELEL